MSENYEIDTYVDMDPAKTGFFGMLVGAIVGGIVGMLMADKRFRNSAKTQVNRFQHHGRKYLERLQEENEQTNQSPIYR
jgi:gas vesicle protein